MTENHHDKKIESLGEKSVYITSEYIENESPRLVTASLVNDAVGRMKAQTQTDLKKVKVTDNDLGP